MGDWYTIGALLGGGVGLGVILAGVFAVSTRGLVVALVIGLALSASLALGFGWTQAAASAIGAIVGVVSGSVLVQGALRRGGTRLGVAGLMAGAGLVIMLLSGIPLVGYILAVAVPLFALRLRGRQPTRFAGLRTLDK